MLIYWFCSLAFVVGEKTWFTMLLDGLHWKWTKIILLFLRLHPSTAFRTLFDYEGYSIYLRIWWGIIIWDPVATAFSSCQVINFLLNWHQRPYCLLAYIYMFIGCLCVCAIYSIKCEKLKKQVSWQPWTPAFIPLGVTLAPWIWMFLGEQLLNLSLFINTLFLILTRMMIWNVYLIK